MGFPQISQIYSQIIADFFLRSSDFGLRTSLHYKSPYCSGGQAEAGFFTSDL